MFRDMIRNPRFRSDTRLARFLKLDRKGDKTGTLFRQARTRSGARLGRFLAQIRSGS